MDDMDLSEVHAKKCPEIVDEKDDFHLFQAATCLNRGRLRLANDIHRDFSQTFKTIHACD